MSDILCSVVQLVLVVGRWGGDLPTEASGFRSEHSECVFALLSRANTDSFGFCLAWIVLEERADYSRRGEMTKHDLTPLSVENTPPRTAALTPVNIIRGGKCCNYVRYKREMAIGPVVSLHASTASRCRAVWTVSSH